MQPDSISNLYGWWLGDGLRKGTWEDASSNGRHLWAINSDSIAIDQIGLNSHPTVTLKENASFERRDSLETPFSLGIVFRSNHLEGHPYNAQRGCVFGDGENGLFSLRKAKTHDLKIGLSSGGPIQESSEELGQTFYSAVAVFDGEDSYLKINGQDVGLVSSGPLKTDALRSLIVGQGLFSGEVAEVFSYDRAITDSEASGLSSYLNTKYSLDGSVDATITSSNRRGKHPSVFSVSGADSQGSSLSYDWSFVYPEENAPDLFDITGTVTNSGSELYFLSQGVDDVYYLNLEVTDNDGDKSTDLLGFVTDEDAPLLTKPTVTVEAETALFGQAVFKSRVVQRVTKEAHVKID